MRPILTLLGLVTGTLFIAAESEPAKPKIDESIVSTTTLYDRDATHLWNRVHAALLMRVGPDGKIYGHDRLEPLLWAESKHLKSGKSEELAVAVMQEFVKDHGEKLIDDPAKRALLQHDLWLVFRFLQTDRSITPSTLERLVVTAIDRLALTREQIAKLPDNYQAAVESKAFAERFLTKKPLQSYLPSDLFDPNGPWISLGRTNSPAAPQHMADTGTNAFTNSVFFIFLRLPDGRAATLEYAKKLESLDKLLAWNPDPKKRELWDFVRDTRLPPLPVGSQFALVRRALLVDTTGRVVASPLVESVQIRIHQPSKDYNLNHTFLEYQLRRADLIAGRSGGLRDISAERDFKTGFQSHQWDEFTNPLNNGRPFPLGSQPNISNRESCVQCHNRHSTANVAGVEGFNTVVMMVDREMDEDTGLGRSVPGRNTVAVKSVAEVERAAVAWTESRPAWKALQSLRAK